ncbi:MAG: hypothetical protein V3U24_01220 [Candidatus Neomarinimicrobiota bacterium]
MRNRRLIASIFGFFLIIIGPSVVFVFMGCVPPSSQTGEDADAGGDAARESADDIRCLRLLSSAAEYYKNTDWKSTVRVYDELVDLGCDAGSEEEVYQYWAIAYEYLGKFDSSEYVLLQGLKHLPENINLHNRLAYAYKRLGNREKEIFEYQRIIDLIPQDTEPLKRLSELYGEAGLHEDQIYYLEKILELEPDNKDAQGDLAQAYEQTGKDPLDIYRQRFADNSDNLSFGLDLADQLTAAEEHEEAIRVLNRLKNANATNGSVSMKLVLKKLSQAYYRVDRLEEASSTYEELFELDPRDFTTALDVVKINIDLLNFAKAMRWVEESIEIAPDNGEIYGHKGLVYYRAFQECRKDFPSSDDRIIASLAHKYFVEGEQLNFKRFLRDRRYLEDNKDDLMFGQANWFMLDEEVKRQGSIAPSSDCYSWATESLTKDPSWK